MGDFKRLPGLVYTELDMYQMYKKERKSWPQLPVKDANEFQRILYFMNTQISRMIITKRLRYKLPFGLGYLGIDIGYRSSINKPIKVGKDGTMKETANAHSKGTPYRWNWDVVKNKNMKLFPISLWFYEFEAYRDEHNRFAGKRGLAQYITECNTDPNKHFMPSVPVQDVRLSHELVATVSSNFK